MTLLVLKTLSDERSPLPIDPTRHPMTNPAVPLGVADDQGPLCPCLFSDCNPLTKSITVIGLVVFRALGNDLLGPKTLSDERSLLPICPTRHPTTNPAVPLGVADDQGPLCLYLFFDRATQ